TWAQVGLKLFLLISNSEQGYGRLFYVDGRNVSRVNIKDFDAIIPRIGDNVNYGAFIVEQLNTSQYRKYDQEF
ncbi:MAG: hypothetical protein KAR19_20220, partial [Bacteroidales bacterium]|nr:hypothetical protein [Bacteroidales bacterium]